MSVDAGSSDRSTQWWRDGLWEGLPGAVQRALGVMGAIAGPIALVLGLRDLFDLEGPGWAVVLAWFGAALVAASLLAVFVQQIRHHNALRRQARDAAVAVVLPNRVVLYEDL